MSDNVIIPARFNGPPRSANGGYACGLFAGLVDGDAETTLRAPPPLDRRLTVRQPASEPTVAVLDGDTVVAEVSPSRIDVEVPHPPTLEEAEEATTRWFGPDEHVFPTCFTCGPARAEGDGMRVFPGPTADGSFHASPWMPHPSVADDDGLVPDPVMWAALDCPGMAAVMEGRPALLGRMAARVDRSAEAGTTYLVYGWELGRDGRKLYSASAIVDLDGVLAVARLTSIAVEPVS